MTRLAQCVRSGLYSTEVDVYSFGKLLQNLAQRVSSSEISELFGELHYACTHRLEGLRPTAAALVTRLAAVLPAINAAGAAAGSVRPASQMDRLLALADANRANHSRAGDTGSDLRAICAPVPSPRPLEWDTTDAPSDVDRDNVVYVSASRYHHRLCPVVASWHHRGKTHMKKWRFADIAHRVTFKPCRRCAHYYKFSFSVYSGVGLHRPVFDRPSPYPIDNIGRLPKAWMVEILEPSGDEANPIVSYLGPVYSNDGPWEARTAALRNLAEASSVYEHPLREPSDWWVEYEETPKGGSEGSGGLTINFHTSSGDKVKLRVRTAEYAARLGWPAAGDGIQPGDADSLSDEPDELPRICFQSPGWGKIPRNPARDALLMRKALVFNAAMMRGEDPWEAEEWAGLRGF